MPDKQDSEKHLYALMIGRWSPMHAGNVAIIKKLAPRFEKMYVMVAGLRESANNPFSYDLRKEIIRAALGPLMYKVQISPAVIKKGKKLLQTGFVAALIDKLDILNENTHIMVLVGTDRYKDYKQQLEDIQKGNAAYKNVKVVDCGTALNEFGRKISATSIRGALLNDDTEFVKQYMPPLISDNSSLFKKFYDKMRAEIEQTMDAQQFEKIIPKDSEE